MSAEKRRSQTAATESAGGFSGAGLEMLFRYFTPSKVRRPSSSIASARSPQPSLRLVLTSQCASHRQYAAL